MLCFCRVELKSGIKFDSSATEAQHLDQTFELSSHGELGGELLRDFSKS